ncbi:Gmad2 immunoglobulin-like domain-containing protein [Nocardioides sp. cx-169]|uniref:Gmad2 immunoglobulin-like domain-containing protein n=1 Tax=Nocardioides sp. cx-169 TaxID=2899080 RepID=UPI001E64F7BF|nr:Gmad2 immunoglobulin-like domain-containing protein [Nocardioides sp. cx-169]MCD4534515.1 Gmad2 immunoglobulin-like domain-containing protein [Nocardioides sp. cx-169]
MTAPRSRFLALSFAGLVGSLVLAGCGDDPEPTASDPGGSDSSSAAGSPTPEPSTEPSVEPSPSETESSSTETVTVPVYFSGDTPQGPRLFREFRKVRADNPLAEAAALMAAGDAQDPDYGTLFPAGGFASISYGDGGFVVELADDTYTTAPSGMTQQAARLAAQQLIYTLQGVQQKRDPVTVELDGQPTTLFGIDTAGGLTEAPQIDVLGLVSVTSPEEGATVSGKFTASGVASSFEATVPWRIRQGEKVVLEGFATAEGWMDKLYPWQSEVDVSRLAPGEYTFEASTDDPSGGEGSGPTVDTKTITVK